MRLCSGVEFELGRDHTYAACWQMIWRRSVSERTSSHMPVNQVPRTSHIASSVPQSPVLACEADGMCTHMLELCEIDGAPDGRVLVLLGPVQRAQLGPHARAPPLQLLQCRSLHIALYPRHITGVTACREHTHTTEETAPEGAQPIRRKG